MRIAVIETAPYGGLLHYSVQLGDGLAERGHDVDLITPRGNELAGRRGAARMRDVLTPTVHSTAPPPPGFVAATVKRAGVAVRMTRSWARILWEVARGSYDVVLLDPAIDVSVSAAGAAALTAIPGGPPITHVCHNARVFNRWARSRRYSGSVLLRLLLGAAYGRFDLIFMHGERSREEFESQWPDASIALIPHGDERVFADDPPAPSTEQHVLFFGHWNRVKGLPVLMEAFDIVAERVPEATLTIAGAANPQEVDVEGIRRWAAGHGGRVELIENYVPLEEVPGLFARAATVAVPYVAGYQSGIVHLAMTMARPVVASDIGDIGSAVVAGETGLLVPPGDAPALAEALETILTEPGLAERMGSSGRARVMSESAWENVAETVESNLRQVVRSPR
jgi:D-inositol-3-phosphate glycosyltransferase